MADVVGPMWVCAACGRRFANRHQTHTCGLHSLDRHFAGRPPVIRTLFDHVCHILEGFGPVTILPEKTRIAFQVRMSFAQLTPRQRWIDGHLVLARAVADPRFRKVESLSPRNHVHHFRLSSPDDLDAAFVAWLAEAYAVGEQRHRLKPGR